MSVGGQAELFASSFDIFLHLSPSFSFSVSWMSPLKTLVPSWGNNYQICCFLLIFQISGASVDAPSSQKYLSVKTNQWWALEFTFNGTFVPLTQIYVECVPQDRKPSPLFRPPQSYQSGLSWLLLRPSKENEPSNKQHGRAQAIDE